MDDLKAQIRHEALRQGFSRCGFAGYATLEHLRPFYTDYFQQQRQAGMSYLERYLEKRIDPALVMEGTKTVIALLINYYPPETISSDDNYIIARYAYGADYHDVIRAKLKAVTTFMEQFPGNVKARGFVDSGVITEKVWAQRCGLGWQGKNTLLISPGGGSFFFIGIILTNLELLPDEPETDHCGTCDKCLKACPTSALDSPYQLNPGRCISYLTIETKEEISPELRTLIGDRVYGCDICQEVCPYNRHTVPHDIREFLPSERLMRMRKPDWESLTETEFDDLFAGSAVKRAGYEKLRRFFR